MEDTSYSIVCGQPAPKKDLALIAYVRSTVGGGMSMSRRRFLWLDNPARCSGDEQSGKTLDGVEDGETRSEPGQKWLFRQHHDSFS